MSNDKKYVKVYCDKSKKYGLVTIENNNGYDRVVNFYEIDDDTAKQIDTSFEGELPDVSMYLKPNAINNSRTPRSMDKSGQCGVKKGELWYQCLFCSHLDICSAGPGSSAIYFLMDASGSMEENDRREAAKAVKSLVAALSGSGNVYSFVAWSDDADYVFQDATNPKDIERALDRYIDGKYGGGCTYAGKAFALIYQSVKQAKLPVRILFVTDGYLHDPDNALIKRNDLLAANKDVEVLAIGITGADQGTLSTLGTVPEFSKVVGGSSSLTSTFEQIADTLKKSGNNF
ncbi:MAG: VWA domain-containing protein [Clostridia bacterium]|nr:VWA domain-containing protein [Clostridia bacterium]